MPDDLAKLQGKWLQVWYERDGVAQPIDEEAGWKPVTEIIGDRFIVSIADGSVVLEGVFKLDDTLQPKTIDWLDGAGPYASDHPILAIYELTDTSFAFCAAYDGAARPTTFETGPRRVLRRMQRVR